MSGEHAPARPGQGLGRARAAVGEAVARLEAAALALPDVPVTAAGPGGDVSWGEEVCDRLIDLAAARAWLRAAAPGPAADGTDDLDDLDEMMHACVRWVVGEDVVRTRSRVDTYVADMMPVREGQSADAAHRLVTSVVTFAARPAYYDGALARLRAALGPRPAGRAAAAWDLVDEAVRGLGVTREEWVGADPAFTAAGGWVLVERLGRIQLATALLAAAAGQPDPLEAQRHVNAVRRYTWNWLRQPPPEAATEVHVRRTGELTAWLRGAPPAAVPGRGA
ncbi:hypothetical protein ABZY31_16510 [Streptomyces sp. NPDC006529]|uniref:hypothetical protein n=1 Tax=Streptomyces sp. NPDC006529 TaxID=3157177 RepID=UPI0033AA85F7